MLIKSDHPIMNLESDHERTIQGEKRKRPAISSVQHQRPADSSVQHQRPAISSVQHQRPADSSVQHSRPAISSVQPSRPAVSSVQPSRPAISSVQPSRPADSSVQPSRPAISSVQHQRPADSSVQHQRPAVSSFQPSRPAISSVQHQRPTDSSVQPSRPVVSSVQPSRPVVSSVQPSRPADCSIQQPRQFYSVVQRTVPVISFTEGPRPVVSLTRRPELVDSSLHGPRPVEFLPQRQRSLDYLVQRTAQVDSRAQRHEPVPSLAHRPRPVDSLDKRTKQIDFSNQRQVPVNSLSRHPRTFNSLAHHPRQVDFLAHYPRQVDSLAHHPRPVDNLTQRPRPVDFFTQRPRPVEPLARHPKPVDSLAHHPRQVDSLVHHPRQVDSLAHHPRQVDSLVHHPRQVDSLAHHPRQVDSLNHRPRQAESLAHHTSPADFLIQRQASADSLSRRVEPTKSYTHRPITIDSFLGNISRNLHGIDQYENSSNRVIYMSSVIVISKSTGREYEVFQSPLVLRRERSIIEYVNPLIAGTATTFHSQQSLMELEVESPQRTRELRSPDPSQTHSSASKATQFGMNIGNPTMQKKVQAKLQEAKTIFRFPPADEVYPAFDNSHGLRATRSKPSTPTLSRRYGERTSPSPSIDSRFSERVRHSPTKLSKRIIHSTPSSTRSSPAFMSQIPPRNDTTSDFLNDNASISNESLVNDFQQNHRDESRSDSPVISAISDRQTPHESSSPRKPRKGPSSLKGLFLNFKTQLSPKKLDVDPSKKHTRTGSNESYESRVSKEDNDLERSTKSYLERSTKIYQEPNLPEYAVSSDIIEPRRESPKDMLTDSMDYQKEHPVDSVEDPRNIFWTPALSFHPFKHGDRRVKFASLWPKYKELREMLQNSGVQQTILNSDAVLDICTLACTCGPVHLLQCLLDLEMIRIDQPVEGGSGLLHLALLAHNLELAQYLMASKISPKIRDIAGLTADQVCYNPVIRKQMAPRYILSREAHKDKALLKPSLQDKDSIFKLVSNPRHFADIQKKLQTLDFNVNTECDNNGDFLLHIAVRRGLNQLPLLMALVNIQRADIELCNAEGMTPLMIASAAGNCVLCDVLICLFGADPNKRSPQSGRIALHNAAEGNHRKTVECLIRRGADINMEDHEGLRADDLTVSGAVTDDCQEIIVFNRTKRLEMLSDLVKKGDIVSSQLLPSDLCVVDGDGNTLIMIAAAFNRFQTVHCLIEISRSTLNAQHSKTGMTALAIASKMGNAEAVTILLRHRACPTIADMNGYLPLHQAVMNNHESVVDVFLDHFPDTYVSLYKAMRLCKRTSLHTKLKSAWERRQEEIVTPKLLGCTLNGDSEELFLLLDEGDSINPKSGTGNWPLYLAVENGHLEVLKLLFERGGDILKRHPTTGATALHLAAKMGHQTIISYLLQYCRNSHNDLSTTTLQIINPETPTKSDNYTERRKRLLDINAVDREHKTALQLAAEKGFSRIVDLLLSYGATTALLDHAGNLVTCPQYEGVRIMIESRRQQHTHQIIKAIEDKTKKSLPMLQQIWLPKFDHNLRSREGSTPLMIAAATGKVQIIQFLLESAVYPEVTQYESDSDDSDSDADSGVLDPTSGFPKDSSKSEDEFQASLEAGSVANTVSTDLPRESKQNYFTPSLKGQGDELSDNSDFHHKRLTQIVHDSNRPKSLSIFHDGIISHVCAVNLNDGTNVLHHSIKTADAPHILQIFLEADPTPLNMQDDRGETVLHMACRLRRKKSVELILARPDLDLNIRTFDGQLPEEVTSSKAIRKLVGKGRASLTEVPPEKVLLMHQEVSSCGSSEKTVSISGSTVNFDKIHSRYETLKSGAKVK